MKERSQMSSYYPEVLMPTQYGNVFVHILSWDEVTVSNSDHATQYNKFEIKEIEIYVTLHIMYEKNQWVIKYNTSRYADSIDYKNNLNKKINELLEQEIYSKFINFIKDEKIQELFKEVFRKEIEEKKTRLITEIKQLKIFLENKEKELEAAKDQELALPFLVKQIAGKNL